MNLSRFGGQDWGGGRERDRKVANTLLMYKILEKVKI